jgi:hypothetical protein
VTIAYYDVPSTPATYAGATTPSTRHEATPDQLYFNAPAAATYVADVSLSQGSIDVGATTLASSGSVNLGPLDAGLHHIRVAVNDGPQAKWSITLRAIPVVLSGVGWNVPFAPPGEIIKARYTVSGDAVVTASVLSSGDTTVRSLAARLAVSRGDLTLTWDGLDSTGSPIADGNYRLRVDVSDAAGTSTSDEAGVVLDGHGPTITFVGRSAIPPTRGVAVRVADALSGVGGAALKVDNRTVGHLARTSGEIVYRPLRGWRTGTRHTLSVRAVDNVGNVSTQLRTVQIR